VPPGPEEVTPSTPPPGVGAGLEEAIARAEAKQPEGVKAEAEPPKEETAAAVLNRADPYGIAHEFVARRCRMGGEQNIWH
jgi:hypothetical protein